MKKVIGVLAVQGAFAEHIQMLNLLNIKTVEIRKREDLFNHKFDGLILPGGESTAMSKIMHDLEIFAPLKQLIESGIPVLATCAGLILLSKKILNDEKVHFAVCDTQVVRNAYGRQLGSFTTNGQFKGVGYIPMIFIRAPYIDSVSGDVEILATYNNKIVAAKQNNIIMTAFHPELTNDTSVHEFFINSIQ